MTNKEFFDQVVQISMEIIQQAKDLDPEEPFADNDLKRLQIMTGGLKQVNNSYRVALQHDIAKAKLKNYQSSFLEEHIQNFNDHGQES